MKKICASLLLFLISFLFVGCNNYVDAYYFMFVRDSFSCKVGDTVNICEIESKTNINTYEHMHIYTDNKGLAQIDSDNLSVKFLKEGSATIFISGKYGNEYLVDSIVINISANSDLDNGDNAGGDSGDNDSGNNDGNVDENLYELSGNLVSESFVSNCKVVCYNIVVNNENYVNFDYEILSCDDLSVSISAYSSLIEIVYKVGSHIEIKIYDNTNVNNYFILNLS